MALSKEGKKWILEAHGSADDLKLVEFEVTEPGPEEVLLRVLMTTATYTDQLIMRGNYRPSPPLPLTPGYDCIGEVLKVGSAVTTLSPGDRVAAMPQAHCMTTHLLQPANKVIKVDRSEDPKLQVACIRTGVTAYQMLHRCCSSRLGSNAVSTTMLIHGATGASGSFLLQCALAAGVKATNIFATCACKNLNVLSAYGVHAIPYDQEPSFDEVVMRETNGRGVDAIFDAVVLGGYYERAQKCLSPGGKYIAYGFTQNEKSKSGVLSIPSVIYFFARMSMLNTWSCVDGRSAEFYMISSRRDSHPDEFEQDLQALLKLVADKTIVPSTSRTWRFTQAKDALVSIANNSHLGIPVVSCSTD
jgi:NADPH:quinone reductase-like Zn-dependent oxidoreductase